MIFNMTGGAPLNFQVVGGTTQPTNPKENTIWVNTSTEITGWAFSADEPSNPATGMVWIQTYSSGDIEMNALKKNAINLVLFSLKQYSGSWTQNEGAIYQNGAWVEFAGDLYVLRNGEVAQSKVGRWVEVSSLALGPSGLSAEYNGEGGNSGYFATKIDVTDYKRLTFRGNLTLVDENDVGQFYAGLTSTKPVWGNHLQNTEYFVAYANPSSISGQFLLSIPLTNVRGSYYIAISAIATFTVTEIVLVK